MIKNKCTKGLFISILFLLSGCIVYDPPTGQLDILNYTDSAIYVYSSCTDSLNCENGLKLFLNTGGGKDAHGQEMKDIIAPHYRINAYSWGSINGFGTTKKQETNCKDSQLRLYFIKEITMKAKSWKEICENKLYNKKMIFMQQELDSLSWRVIYEPAKE